MVAEKRALRNNFLSLIILTYYSICVLILSFFSEYFSNYYSQFVGLSTTASVVVLVSSLVVSGFGFERTAWLHRECYLSLQKIYDSKLSEEHKNQRYHRTLTLYPNHSSSDYHDFLVQYIFFDRKHIFNNGIEVTYTTVILIWFFARKSTYILFIIIAFGGPVVFFFAPILWICS